MLAHDSLRLGDRRRQLSGVGQGGQTGLDGGQPQLSQTGDLALGELLEAEVAIGRPAPQPQRPLEHVEGGGRIPGAEEADAPFDLALEAHRVDRLGVDPEEVAGGLGDEHVRAAAASAGRLETRRKRET